ncbi:MULTISPECIES: hypothetical protein [Bradyrhizobium]|uniref:Uncharacterized protein n=1 Tax=Bradyrhizobium frederickii TaxID=2560054 RepID=A0A4Y9KQ20_9BRAD|nr:MULTISPECIES: hypothetical protein [Bradyrhizobium]RTE88022.1 hypothetical protein D6B98_38415 [Bradyrhizobium sp. LVM 105]TFV29462.1 hypothetical protein E4K66_37695 [Bradyrhizobium frederickii]
MLNRVMSVVPLFKFIILTFSGFFDLGLPLGTFGPPDVLRLGFGPKMILTVIGIESIVTIVSRHRASTICDENGARRTVFAGLIAAILAALFLRGMAVGVN